MDPKLSTSRVAIVIPTWNRANLLARTLESLRCQAYPIGRVIVVDNGSTDGSADVARKAGAQVIPLTENAGFATAVNQGIREAVSGTERAEFIGILNNDVTLAPDWLSQLMARLEATNLKPDAAWFASGKILDAQSRNRMDGSFDAVCRGGCAAGAGMGN